MKNKTSPTRINYSEAAKLLREHDNIGILTHRSPDGDTIGCGFGLYYALTSIGKNACVLCSDDFPRRYNYLYGDYADKRFLPEFFVAVDIADTKLLGTELKKYADYIDLCIDHHQSNTHYAKNYLVDGDAAAACEVMAKVLEKAEIPITKTIAECLYTGMVTDTGCFKYPATTAETHRIAAKLIDTGIPYAFINRQVFDTKSKQRIAIESYAISHMEYYLDEQCAFVSISNELLNETGAQDDDLEGLAPLTTELETVEVGILVKERDKGKFRVSVRSVKNTDVSAICAKFGGGGHYFAAGCVIDGTLADVRMKLLKAVASDMGIDLWVL
jgi:phosphoesterase RecJ-like protein